MTCEDDDYDTQALSVCQFLLRDSWLGVWTSHKLFQNQTTCRPRSTFPNLSGPTPQPPLSLAHTRSHHIRTECSISLLEGQHFRPVSFHPRFHGLIIYGAGSRGLNPAHINARAHSETQTVRLLVFGFTTWTPNSFLYLYFISSCCKWCILKSEFLSRLP